MNSVKSPLGDSINSLKSPLTYVMFWSGGWDSTFLLLKTLWTTTKSIDTYYVGKIFKPQETLELQAIQTILAEIEKHDVEKQKRVNFIYLKRPEITHGFYCSDVGKIIMDTRAKQQQDAKPHATYVPQLDLLIYFARILGLNHPAYGVETPAVPRTGCQSAIVNYVNDDDGLLSEEVDAMWHPLRILSFPIIKMTKADMYHEARRLGFLDILNLARTCIHPHFKDNKMCGFCSSCKEVKPVPELSYRFQ